MASMGSFPTGVDSSILVHGANHHRPITPIPAYRPRKSVVVAGIADCNSAGFSSNTSVDLFSRVSACSGCGGRRRRWKTQHVKATTEGSGQGETSGESEEALQATIEKSKKALAIQRELLQQIAERRKIVSSIKNTIIDTDGEQPNKESNVTVSGLDAAGKTLEPGKDLPGIETPFAGSTQQQSKEVQSLPLKSFPGPNSEPSSNNNASNELKNTKEVISSASKISTEDDSKKNLKDSTLMTGTLPYKWSGKEEELNRKLNETTVRTAVLRDKPYSKEEKQLEDVKERNPEDANVKAQDPTNEDMEEPSSNNNVSKELKNTKEAITSASKTSTEDDSKNNLKDSTLKTGTLPYKWSGKEEESDKNLKDTTVRTAVLPYKPYSKEEKQHDLEEGNPEDANLKAQDPTNEDMKPPPLAGANVMNIIIVAAECAPWIKTGGLGDVAGALPKALARRGHRVMVVVPRYGNYAEAQDSGVRKRYKVDGQDFEINYFHTYIDGVDFVFIESPAFRHVENNIYGGSRLDILKRMILFCKAAVEVPWHVPCGGVCYGDGNLAFIANDWHTALLPVYLKAYYRDNGLMKYARSVLVIHNIAHQGRGPLDDFNYVDLPPHYFDLFKMYDPVGGDHFNIFAAGLKTADRIVTVSHGYAWELKTSEGGWGLHGIISENDWKFRGIVNGIDTKDWSPELDAHLQSDGYVNYSLETLHTGKPQCKAALQKELGLPVRKDVPLIGFIGRLDNQKGVDLIAEAVPWMMDQDVQLVMLGTGRPDLEELLRKFEGQYNDRARGWVGFSVKTAHRITAGADIILMPSRFEPCGLNQLYAMRYGTIPVVHAVGGLRDTVKPFNPFEESGLGWTFSRADTNELINALGNCLLTYRQYKESWEGLQRRGMLQDLSWDNAAQKYEEVLVAAKYQW